MIKGPAIFLAQFAGAESAFNILRSIAKWVRSRIIRGCRSRPGTRGCSILALHDRSPLMQLRLDFLPGGKLKGKRLNPFWKTTMLEKYCHFDLSINTLFRTFTLTVTLTMCVLDSPVRAQETTSRTIPSRVIPVPSSASAELQKIDRQPAEAGPSPPKTPEDLRALLKPVVASEEASAQIAQTQD